MDIQGKLALVTGAASGIGRACSVALAARGAEAVVLADLDPAGNAETARLVESAGAAPMVVTVDVSDPAGLARLYSDVAHRLGPPDIVLNNAGIVSGSPAWPSTSLARLLQVVEINLGAVVVGTRLAVEQMRGRGGTIINVGSLAAFEAVPHDPVYAATKAGVVAFTRSCGPLHAQLGIRVNVICPGLTDTPMLAQTGDGIEPADWLKPAIERTDTLGPNEVAAAVVALIEDDTRAGEVLVLDSAPLEQGASEK
jgi:3-oxoacyl-[acyl-carrier protein] reductase